MAGENAWSNIPDVTTNITITQAIVGPAGEFRNNLNNNDANLKSAIDSTDTSNPGIVKQINDNYGIIQGNIQAIPQVLIGSGETPPTPIGRSGLITGDVWFQVITEE